MKCSNLSLLSFFSWLLWMWCFAVFWDHSCGRSPTSSMFALWHHVLVVRFLILFILFCEDLSPCFFLLLPSHLSLGCGTGWWLGSFILVIYFTLKLLYIFFWYIWSEFSIMRCSQHTECEVAQTLFMRQSLPKQAWWWGFQERHFLV